MLGRKRPTNSELRLGRLDGEESRRTAVPGIFELFKRREPEPAPEPGESAPPGSDRDTRLTRDPGT